MLSRLSTPCAATTSAASMTTSGKKRARPTYDCPDFAPPTMAILVGRRTFCRHRIPDRAESASKSTSESAAPLAISISLHAEYWLRRQMHSSARVAFSRAILNLWWTVPAISPSTFPPSGSSRASTCIWPVASPSPMAEPISRNMGGKTVGVRL